DLAVDGVGDMPRQRGLAGAGIAEQAEHLRRGVLAGLRLQPVADGFQRGILMRGKGRHGPGGRLRAWIATRSIQPNHSPVPIKSTSAARNCHAQPTLDLRPARTTLTKNKVGLGETVMKFGIFYELQLPRPWVDGDELKLYQNALTQLE